MAFLCDRFLEDYAAHHCKPSTASGYEIVKLAISDLVRLMKGRSSHKVEREFPQLKRRYWGRRFWGRGYFSTTNGAVTEDIVLQYLEQHITDPTGDSR